MMAWTPPHEKLGRKGQPRAVVFTGLLVSLSEEMEAPSCWGSLLCADTMRHAGTCSLVAAPDQSQLHKPALLGRACPHEHLGLWDVTRERRERPERLRLARDQCVYI